MKFSFKMTGLNIEGDLSQISEPQLKYIESVIKELGFTNGKVTIETLGQVGDNYVANVKRIFVKDGNGKSMKMVAKIAPAIEQIRQMTQTEMLFRNEHIMYTKVLPKFTEIEVAASVPKQERLRYAKCYGSFSEAPNEVILLEDLNDSDFVMLDRFKSLSNECVKSVLKNFACLHSLSYVLKHKEPSVFEEFKDSLFDMWAVADRQEDMLMYFKQVEINAMKIVENDIHKKAINGAVIGAVTELGKMADYEKNSKQAIIQQGDSWTNNIMFKFDGENLSESIMIDYQLSKATNPATDILYMVFNCTDYEVRKEHYHDWIDYYHCELDNALSNFGLKATNIFSRDQLDADLKRYGKVMFGLSILLAGILSMKANEAAMMKEAMETSDAQMMLEHAKTGLTDTDSIQILKKRIEGLVDSHHDFGLI